MGRPSTPVLSVERIARAALAQVDRTGEFTVAQVADALRVRPSSLYNHVSGKAQIVEEMRSLVFRPMARPTAASSWDASIRVTLRAYRDAFATHPRLIPLLTAQTVSAPDVMQIYDDLATVLGEWGLPEDRLLDVITILDSFVIGSALDLVAPDEVWEPTRAGSPQLAAGIRAAPAGRVRADRAFDLGVDLLLSGIAGLRT